MPKLFFNACPERFFVKDIYLDIFPVFMILMLCRCGLFHLSFSLTIWMFLGWRVCRWKVSLMTARVFVCFQEQICFFAWRSLHVHCSFLFFFCLQLFKPPWPVWRVLLHVSAVFVWRGFISGSRCSNRLAPNTSLIVLPDCVSAGRPSEWPVTNQQSVGVACSGRSSACSENSSHCSC